jgi:hypothetical protein
VQPDDWSRSVKAAASHELTDAQQAYVNLWGEFLDEFHEAHPGWSKTFKPPKASWVGFPAKRKAVHHTAVFCRPSGHYRLRAEAYIDTGDEESTSEIFNNLLENRAVIEAAVGEPLEWDLMEGKQAARISVYFGDDIRVREEKRWPEARAWLIESLGKMRAAFDPDVTKTS